MYCWQKTVPKRSDKPADYFESVSSLPRPLTTAFYNTFSNSIKNKKQYNKLSPAWPGFSPNPANPANPGKYNNSLSQLGGNPLQVVRKCPQSDPNLIQSHPKVSPKDPNVISKWPQSDPTVNPKWSQSDPKVTLKWSQSDPKVTPKWPQIDPKLTPKWPQSEPQVIPKSVKIREKS